MIDGGLRPLFRQNIKHFQWTTIETGSTQSGIPDSEFCHAGRQAWLEFKKTDTRFIKKTKHWGFQIGWMERRGRAGGRVFVAVRMKHDGGPRKGLLADELWLLDGRFARAIDSYGLTVRMSYVHGRWSGGPSSWNWREVEALLLDEQI